MLIVQNDDVLPGYHVLMRNGEPIWMGPIGVPIEGCDTVVINPLDYDLLAKQFRYGQVEEGRMDV